MFGAISFAPTVEPLQNPDGTRREIPPPTPIGFPKCLPQAEDKLQHQNGSLINILQSIQRPTDISISHFEALGIHVIPDAPASDILPDPSFLPPVEQWNAVPAEDLLEANPSTRRPLSNGNLAPGIQTYRERVKELLIPNTAAFRTIRRIPAPAGETAARLGNAYEFFKNLEFFSGYWLDTSLEEQPSQDEADQTGVPLHMRTHMRTGNGSQLPPDYRQSLLSSFTKLIAYDFGCNVSFPRVEPRLHLTPPPLSNATSPPSYFNSGAMFIYRTPTDRMSARSGIVEGPIAALSSRSTTVFATAPEETLDFAREVVAILLTAQQRARESQPEVRFGEGKWWTTKPRWGGGPGGPIGKEEDKSPDLTPFFKSPEEADPVLESVEGNVVKKEKETAVMEAKMRIGGINGPSPSKRSRKNSPLKPGNLPIYEGYRKMSPPSSTWDRKARYMAIGREPGADGEHGFDDIFLLSGLNHHISILRARVPRKLIAVLNGAEEGEGWERVCLWRSVWFDMFKSDERIEAMGLLWGVMSWLMRKIDAPAPAPTVGPKVEAENKENGAVNGEGGDKMDLS